MQDKLISNSLVFCGPFLGEFGWELTHWMPHVRWLRNHYKERHLIVASYPGRHPLYYGIANEFFPLPEWFLKEKYELDCFEALCPENVYGDLLKYFREIYKGKFSEIIETRTPRGFNKILREMNHITFNKLIASVSANKYCNDLIAKHNNKPCVIFFARAVERKMFLDITNNRPLPVEALGGRLPPRNWPRSNWEDLFEMLYAKYNDKVTFVIGGTKDGNCLTNIAINKHPDVIDLTDIDKTMSLDITMAFLNKAMLSISSQSGPTHLSVQCGCTSFVYGHEQQRHSVDDNPLKIPVVFLETPADKYNDPPYVLYEEIDVLIKDLLKEKFIKINNDGFGQKFEINGQKYITAHDPACNCKDCKMDDNLIYWQQRYSTMAKENVVGHKNWTDKEYKKELSTWNSKLHPFLDSIKKNKLKKALDFGCGIGRFMPLLSDYCDKYFGCDILMEPINKARELVKDEQRIALIENHQIPFDNIKFDLIFSCVTLQHVIDQNLLKSYINQFYKRLSPKGSVLIVENILNAPGNNYLIFRPQKTYIKLFEDAGFELVKEDVFESSNEPHAILLFSKKKQRKRVGIVGVFDVPGSTSIPFGKAFRKLGYEVKELNYRTIAQKYGLPRMNAEIREMSDNVDLMIFSKCNGVDIETFRRCAGQTVTCWHMTDAITHLEQNPDFIEYVKICDFSIVTSKAMQDALISSGIEKPVYHMLQGIDPEEFYPIEAEKKLYDFVFIGTKSSKRDEIINRLKDWGYSIKTYGNGYGEYVTGEAFNKACAEAKICLAINNTGQNIDSFSDRILRYMATGACVLTEYSKGLENYFEEGKEIFWLKEGEDIKAKIGEIFKNYDLKDETYYTLSYKDKFKEKDPDFYLETLDRLIEHSVKLRTISDVPLGAFLSGGIDSSLITYYLAKNSRKVKTFSIGFKEKTFDESSYARQVSNFLGTEHYEEMFSPDEMIKILPDVIDKMDEPFADASFLPAYLLSQYTKEKVTVALSGDGGDEVFAGYPTYFARKIGDHLPKWSYHFLNPLAHLLPVSDDNISFDFKVKKFVSGLPYNNDIRHQIWLGSFDPYQKRELFSRDIISQLGNDVDSFQIIDDYMKLCDTENNWERSLWLDMRFYLQDNMLVKVDRTSMMNSLEVRVPFLDHNLVEFVTRIPANLKYRGNTSKYILKQLAKKYIPENIVNRPKKGFGIPIAKWIKSDLKETFKQTLSKDKISSERFFKGEYVQTLLRQHLENKKDNRKLLWTLFVFEQWLENLR